ncbi:molybdopterin molybdotransferase MoeA [Marinicrinis sediminis]|uniref:Molybdopterin molybdenumtransferase n=1 Tax=Marinicrinis sediminis TaxID=1652465 RepID=A0ABW5R6F0_9BACL
MTDLNLSVREVRIPIAVEEAGRRIVSRWSRPDTVQVSLSDAYGYVLAEPLVAEHDDPPFDRAVMDGYAIRSQDTELAAHHQPVTCQIVGTLPAGACWPASLQKGEAVRIMTGAMLPEGSDAVIPFEEAEICTQEDSGDQVARQDDRQEDKPHELTARTLVIRSPYKAGKHVAGRGSFTSVGSCIAEPGTVITSGTVAALAAFGYQQVCVYRPPVVGIMAMGSELLEVNQPLQAGRIRDSNSWMLDSLVQEQAIFPHRYSSLPDQWDRCVTEVEQAWSEVDILLMSGGASVGDYDFLPSLLKYLDTDILFNKVAMRPGSVTTVACGKGDSEGKWIFGLSGNPASCYVGFQLFVRPLLRHQLGLSDLHLPQTVARLRCSLSSGNAYTRYMRAIVHQEQEGWTVEPLPVDHPGMVAALAQANALMIVPPSEEPPEAGDEMTVLWM